MQSVADVKLRAHFSTWAEAAKGSENPILPSEAEADRCLHAEPLFEYPPDNVTIGIFLESLKRWQQKAGGAFTTLDGVRENRHSLTCSTITV